jgi:hypothetical protein
LKPVEGVEDTVDPSGQSRTPRVRVTEGLGDPSRPIALVEIEGDHDFASRAIVVTALEPLDGNLLVDLSRCSYIDMFVMSAIIGKGLALEKAGHRLELVVPPTATFARSVQQLGVHMLLPVLDELPAMPSESEGA